MGVKLALVAKAVEDPRSTTRVAAAAHAVGPNRPSTAVKSVAN